MPGKLVKREPLSTGSRYAGLPVRSVNGRTELEPRDPVQLSEEQRAMLCEPYTVQQGDMIDLLAYSMCGDSRLWWLIAEINQIEIPDPQRLQPGATIQIPKLNFAERFL